MIFRTIFFNANKKIPLRPKYSSQNPILKHPQPTYAQRMVTVPSHMSHRAWQPDITPASHQQQPLLC